MLTPMGELRAEVAAERERSRAATQVLIAAIGAVGPESYGPAAVRAVERIEALTAERDAATAQRDALAAAVRAYLDAEHSYADCRGVLSDVGRTLTALNDALAGCP